MNKKAQGLSITVITIATFVLISLIILVFVFTGEIGKNKNEKKMDYICNSQSNGEAHIYEDGLTEVCGFKVYSGNCILHGYLIQGSEYILVNGNQISFDALPKFSYEIYNQCHKEVFIYGNFSSCEQIMIDFEIERCRFLKKLGENDDN